MSYTIANIVYGVPLTEDVLEVADKLGYDDPEDYGFEMLYHASSPVIVGYCGQILKKINCVSDIKLMSLLDYSDSTDITKKVEAKLLALDHEIRAVIEEPSTWIIWSTS